VSRSGQKEALGKRTEVVVAERRPAVAAEPDVTAPEVEVEVEERA
jgi:hypothetical protein